MRRLTEIWNLRDALLPATREIRRHHGRVVSMGLFDIRVRSRRAAKAK